MESAAKKQMKRILLIGIGRWGANHLRVLKSMPIELFVADHHEQRLRSVEIPENHRSTDARSLFPRVDAAVVVTPAQAHFETCGELLDAYEEDPPAHKADLDVLDRIARGRGRRSGGRK